MSDGISEIVSLPCCWIIPNSGICSGTPWWSVSSHRATTVLEVPKSTARRPGINRLLHDGFIDGFSLVCHAGEADGHQLSGQWKLCPIDRGMQVGIKSSLFANLPDKNN